MKNKIIFIVSIITVLIIVSILLALWINWERQPGQLDGFAQCVKDSGATFYGAFWCSHCQNQKKMFGKSAKLLHYVECSTPDGQSQLEVCKNKDIKGYPTWEFSDGSRLDGEITLTQLAEKTGCQLP
ncbi:MAG: thioredoxin domain-containing protein [Candidatus Parcubacteria bacterium]|nr:thioredoxin domain-containing protein [Candidatus Parcubacteria bacterium]